MRDAARLQAAIEILDQVLTASKGEGAAADTLVARYFASRRYAGSKDRAAIRDLVFEAIRFAAERPQSGRALLFGLASHQRPDLLPWFDGSTHAPAPVAADEPRSRPSLYPEWLRQELTVRFGANLDGEMRALLARAHLDLRVNPHRADRAEVAAALGADPIAGLPHGLRLASPIPLDRHPLLLAGAIEIQDAGSQQVVALATAKPGETVVDLCAGAGGKTLALAADMTEHGAGRGRLVACDSNRQRLQAMEPRLKRCDQDDFVERRLLDPGREPQALADLVGHADLVLVDAPCSGTGTWRRNPELRWRLDAAKLDRLLVLQSRLIALGASLLKPGGRLVYAVCSVLPAEGARQALSAAAQTGMILRRLQLLSPAVDGCDGFAIACFDAGTAKKE